MIIPGPLSVPRSPRWCPRAGWAGHPLRLVSISYRFLSDKRVWSVIGLTAAMLTPSFLAVKVITVATIFVIAMLFGNVKLLPGNPYWDDVRLNIGIMAERGTDN